jgi:hypothetical protein
MKKLLVILFGVSLLFNSSVFPMQRQKKILEPMTRQERVVLLVALLSVSYLAENVLTRDRFHLSLQLCLMLAILGVCVDGLDSTGNEVNAARMNGQYMNNRANAFKWIMYICACASLGVSGYYLFSD